MAHSIIWTYIVANTTSDALIIIYKGYILYY